MTEPRGSVSGEHNDHEVKFYGISTCIWCRKTRAFLEENKVAFDFVYVDLLESDEREAAKDKVREFNPRCSFPTLIIDNSECVIGYKTEQIKEVLAL